MEYFKSIPYLLDGEDFDIRIFYETTTINVVAFLNGYPANGYRYQVQIPKGCNAKKVLGNYPVPELIETCKNDIKEKKWAKLQKAIQEAKSVS
ncbi:hypothetical protein H8D57_02595 [bacterium]|nr:hypothetical protein [bacterium]